MEDITLRPLCQAQFMQCIWVLLYCQDDIVGFLLVPYFLGFGLKEHTDFLFKMLSDWNSGQPIVSILSLLTRPSPTPLRISKITPLFYLAKLNHQATNPLLSFPLYLYFKFSAVSMFGSALESAIMYRPLDLFDTNRV